jgi:hypothetical protein
MEGPDHIGVGVRITIAGVPVIVSISSGRALGREMTKPRVNFGLIDEDIMIEGVPIWMFKYRRGKWSECSIGLGGRFAITVGRIWDAVDNPKAFAAPYMALALAERDWLNTKILRAFSTVD